MRQNEHKDSMFDHPQCPYYVIANIPLCDFTETNGATEFYLGSHAATTLEDQQPVTDATRATWKPKHPSDRIPWISEGPKEARRAVRPPVQPEVVRGDIMIRDLRTWHAGMPNHSDKHRIMLGLGYQVSNSLSLGVKTVGRVADVLFVRALFIRTTSSACIFPSRNRRSSWVVRAAESRSELISMMTRSLGRPRQTLFSIFDLSTGRMNRVICILWRLGHYGFLYG